MTSSRQMVDSLRVVSGRLKKAAKWNGSDLHIDAKKDSFVFELSCYFRAAVSVSGAFGIEVTGKIIKSRSGLAKARWPKAPGNKSNFSYLNLIDSSNGDIAYQFCPGINIEDIHGKDRAPDINLLRKTASDDPTYTDLCGMWDAKHTNDEKSRLADTEVSDFIFTFEQLGKPSCPREWATAVGESAFKCSGLVTNGKASTERIATLKHRKISETAGYPKSPKTRP